MKTNNTLILLGAAAIVAGCATMSAGPDVTEVIKASFQERGIAKLDRLEQTPLQKACSQADAAGKPLDAATASRLEQAALAAVKPPADGTYLGDWKEGEKIAQSGRGLQFNDTAQTVAGGNCYACHQLSKAEISFGNIGPSLYQYGKQRGVANPADPASAEIVKYTWGKLWNSHAYRACSPMPRFGDAGILTEVQLKHVMALLLDPQSPVNTP
ncbi:sulfur oxidation c-type cytochrome SoxX [Caldimonas brevitalea]|uniref:SoxX protein n=1 Tax=Caldimonas brevitalea TaxID=413882 RepID=A0A0G3BHY3_9BURK|nr:sulfur oxidation c-type cytochrome SoxX [Caldimonas brevitalea]AKJ28962.1 SoxX protein [Caldimonas brevitalea]